MLSLLRCLVVLLLVVTLSQGAPSHPQEDMSAFNRMAKGSQEVPEPLLEKAHDSVIVEVEYYGDSDLQVDVYSDDVLVTETTHHNESAV